MTPRLLKLHPPKFSTIILFQFILLFSLFEAFAQRDTIRFEDVKDVKNFGRFRYIEVKGHTGYHLYAGELLNESVNEGYGAIEVRYGWQNTDPEHWSSRYGYATYGIGFYSGFVGNPAVLGKPNALFGFVNYPLSYPGKKNELEIGFGLGLTYNLEPYDPVSNPDNDAIGSPFAVYFNLYFGGAYKMTREVDLLYGIDFTHFSNGRITTPNYGFNMYGINLGLRYYYNVDQKNVNRDVYTDEILQARFDRPESSEHIKLRESSVEMVLATGTVQNEEDKGTSKRYGIFSGVLDYRYKFNSMHAITAGFDFFYDSSLEPDYPEPSDQWLYGAHIGYDFMFGRFTTRLQAGAYLSDDKGKTPSYLRAAFRYDINKWLFTQLAIKTKNTSRADWVEFGIGFTPFKW